MTPSLATATNDLPHALQPVVAYIDQHLTEPMSLQELADLAGLSIWRFSSVFRQHLGVPPHRYISNRRIWLAQTLLRQGMSAAAVAGACGFYDQSHLSRHFKNQCGMTPGQYLSHARRRVDGAARPQPPATPAAWEQALRP